jgi:hypothetical protein
VTNPHAACDARISQLESKLAIYWLALLEITRFGCDSYNEDSRTCCIDITDDDIEWCQRCIAHYVLDRMEEEHG